jgi:hypothetical protein
MELGFLIQRGRDTRDLYLCTKKDHVRIQRKGNYLHTRKKGLTRNQPAASGTVRDKFLLCKSPHLWNPDMAAQADQYRYRAAFCGDKCVIKLDSSGLW